MDPLANYRVTHVDLIRVSKDTLITADIPVIVKGREEVEGRALLIEIVLRTVRCEFPATEGVANFEFDVTGLDVNDSFYVSDIVVSDEVTILENPEQLVLTIKEPVMYEELLAEEEEELISGVELDDDAEETEDEEDTEEEE